MQYILNLHFRSLSPQVPNCGSNITGDSGIISFDSLASGLEEDSSGDMIWCQWVITASKGSVVELNIEDLHVKDE